ncbi:MAG: zinc ribbon domain-containing protein [Thermoplasmata archaeon]|nr:zinc ribbon domain-containing protein [Thermoplasmata archaeon]
MFFDSNRTADILVMRVDAYPDYMAASLGNGMVRFIGPWSRLNTTSESYSFRIGEDEDGDYGFIIDNTPLPSYGASSGRDVTFFVSVTAMSEPETLEWSSGIGWYPLIIGVILVVVVVGLMLVMLATRRREKDVVLMPYSMQAGQSGQELVTCSNCGNQVPKGKYCAKCGQKFH